METLVPTKPHVLDIILALDSRTLMGEMRGHDVGVLVQNELSSLSATDALLLDMSAASMLDYGFSGFAFGSLFGDARLQTVCHQVIFILAQSSRNAFFQGILKATDRPISSYSQSQAMFVQAGLYCKIALTESGEIDFIGALSDDEATVLKSVNRLKHGAFEQIAADLTLRPEKVHNDLIALVNKGFVMNYQREDYSSYVSYYNFLKASES